MKPPHSAAVCLLLFACISLTIGTAGAQAPPTSLQPQATIPAELSLQDLAGNPQTLETYRGRIVVLNFWATWCVPCREEMPLLVALRKEYAARGLEIVGASADDDSTRAKIAPFLRELKIDFPIWVGATTADMQRLDLGIALPATAILDRDGRIAFRILGPLTEPDLRARLDWLLSDRAAESPAAHLSTFEKHAGAKADKDHDEHGHEGEKDHQHGGAGLDNASTVPS